MFAHNNCAVTHSSLATFVLLSCSPILTISRAAEQHAATKPIRVAIYADAGATKTDVPQVQHCLPALQGFAVKTLTADQIRAGDLKNFDVLIHPGGGGSKQAETLGRKGRET